MRLHTCQSMLVLCCILIITSCTSRITVVVNAISSSEHNNLGKHYFLTSAMEDVDDKDLFFQEFRQYFEYVLHKEGYTRVNTETGADIIIFLGYGISDGMTDISTYSWPIYEAIGGESISITETTMDSSGNAVTTTRVIYIPARVTRVGTTYETKAFTTFNRSAILEARKSTTNNGSGDAVWKLLISSVGTSNDIREVMPYLAAASSGFIGKNSRDRRAFVVEHDDPLLLELKNLLKK